ncbi:hypothetical protein ACJO1P_15935 [Vibrio parahaemolyticus]|uniref:hypothetical protein n=1 Tax=Vibrio parahaemolyticus TaxID=670 RepID=UPI00387B1263
MKKKIIMFDFDRTISLNVSLFKSVMKIFKDSGFDIMICTARSVHSGNDDIFEHFPENIVIFCEGMQKEDFILQHTSISLDDIAFWIDDDCSSVTRIEEIRRLSETDL